MHIKHQSHLSCVTSYKTCNLKKTSSHLSLPVRPTSQIKAFFPLYLITKYCTAVAQIATPLLSLVHGSRGFSVPVLLSGYNEAYLSNC